MANWLRFRHGAESYFGTLEGELVTVYEGDLFDNPRPTEHTQSLDDVEILIPCHPSKMVGLWNNVRSAAGKGSARNKLDILGFKCAVDWVAPIEPNRRCSGLQ